MKIKLMLIALLSFAWVNIGYAAEEDNVKEFETLETVETEESAGTTLGLTVTGNQELPKSLIIVPWKNPQLGELLGKDFNSLIEKEENSLDRDEYLRQLAYDRVKSSVNPTQQGASLKAQLSTTE